MKAVSPPDASNLFIEELKIDIAFFHLKGSRKLIQTNQNEDFSQQKLVGEMKDNNPGTRQSRKGAQLAEADF